ncbi:pilus assembly protein PilQ (plasmid) [Deinococcus sp. KNUC1210]|uniref:type II secretion system protein GspD n=1 Tax=Deinococcus sp. KNUC1210 TaxID=2917691 RepID=UPI001EF0BDBA|nr:secretin N-terminal domain-containing protein [Deinococcus sp. KNUC1210]ULH18089.1 pilus assembly protein PilQ [Deinococcus sp. KNUC1210]
MNKLLALTAVLLLAAPSVAQTPTPTPVLSVTLPSNPKLDKPLTVMLPAGAPLSSVLAAITRASGLTLLARDVPVLPVTLNFKGLTARAALNQVLSLYQDQIKALLVGNTLIVAPGPLIDRLAVTPGSQRRVLEVPVSDDDAKRLSSLTGALVTPVNNTTIVTGTTQQLQDVTALLMAGPKPAPTATPIFRADVALGLVDPDVAQKTLNGLFGMSVTTAYGRAYIQANSQTLLDQAISTLKQLGQDAQSAHEQADQAAAAEQQAQAAQAAREAAVAAAKTPAPAVSAPIPAPAPLLHRTLTTTLSSDLITRLASVNGTIKLTPLDAGTYDAQATQDDLTSFTQAIQGAEVREATRVVVTYPRVPASAIDGLKDSVTTISARSVPGGLEVRGTPQEQVRASMYLAGVVRNLPPEVVPPTPALPVEPITVRVPLAYALPSTVAAELTSLYGPSSASAAPSTPTPAASVPAATSTDASTTGAPIINITTAPTTPSTGNATPPAASDVRIVADERSRSIVLSGPPATIARMQRTIADLDTRLSDVRMALRVEQISGSTGQDLGVDWSVGLGGFSVAQSSGTLSAGYKPGVGPLSFSASLDAARSEGRSNTLLDTTFAAQDGRPANFKNGGQLLLPDTTTTSGGTTSTSRTSYDYGLDVTLTPRLAPDGRIELTVQLQLGEQPVSGIANSVVIAKRSMTTIVTVTPGEPLILGGVLSQDASQTSKGVPLLSQIPVIGSLFGKSNNSASSSVLLITLQAADRTDDRAPTPPQLGDGTVTRVNIPGK